MLLKSPDEKFCRVRCKTHQLTMDDAEIKFKGIEVLNKALGPTDALRFLALFHREPTDYVKISSRLYKGQIVEEIFERAKKCWKG